jgi:molybdopterin molybdotransferase
MISFEEARAIIRQHVQVLGDELLNLDQALGRVLAEDVLADRDYPPFNRSAMDGYAVMQKDWERGIRKYHIAEMILAGQPVSKKLESGFCYKIMTGAAVPEPANMVIRVEDSEVGQDQVVLTAPVIKSYMNIARRGEDLLAGQVIVAAGNRLTPQLVSLLAAVGYVQVRVKKLPVTAVLTTGDEVVDAGHPVLPYQIRNSNSHLIQSMLKANGLMPQSVAHVKDDKAVIRIALEKAMDTDLLIINGGVSAGDADYVPQLLESLNVKKLFHKVAIRPGKPIWVGVKPNGGLVFALPGNPFSCLVTFNLFVTCYLQLAQGLECPEFLKLPFSGTRIRSVNLDEFFPVRLNTDTMSLEAVAINGSGDIRLGLNAQAIAWHPVTELFIADKTLLNFFFLYNS